MNFKPLGTRVLVERLEEETKTSSGIIIPDNAKEKPLMGVVRALGAKVSEECQCVKEGDTIMYGKRKDETKSDNKDFPVLQLDNKEFVVLELEDILGIMK